MHVYRRILEFNNSPKYDLLKKELDGLGAYIEGVGKVLNRMGDYPYCGRVKYHYPRRDAIKFRADALSDLPDIAKSYEYLGTAYGAHRLILARSKVYRLVSDHMLRGLKFTPVVVV